MKKKCPFCREDFDGNAKKKYCCPKCKKNFENSQRSAPRFREASQSKTPSLPELAGGRPSVLGGEAAAYWDKVAPLLMKRGHLNVMSEDAFVELCDLVQRLRGINVAINETNESLLQIDDKWDNKSGIETKSFKESALSDIKRKYSRLLLDYCKQFYLTPLSNRGNFGIDDIEKESTEKDKEKERFFRKK